MRNKFEHLTGTNNNSLDFLIQNYLSKTLTMFMYENLPNTIPQIEIEKILQIEGTGFIHKYNDELIISKINLLNDVVDVYGNAVKGNIFIPSTHENLTVNLSDGVLINNDFLQRGLIPLLTRYCKMIEQCEKTFDIVNVWKRTEKTFVANTDREKESLDKFLKDIQDGKLTPITSNMLFESIKIDNTPSSNATYRDLIDYHQYIKSELYSEIGLYDNKNLKKERMITSEVQSNFNVIYPFVDNMINCRKEAIEKVNKMFGTDIEIGFTSSWEMRFNLGNDIKDVDELENEESTQSTETTETTE